ncbi:hypothetical protein KAFR_0A04520 [Kazachstania africana CBS 2517]|uniref:K Homology domain-containing protein n=1 Tax=Kazachstania africana (strain ATCC 22294 / BCRC 22015 / CBS 2517 / CECT 1963 / NBRC 1671 / NRRL Y-8276) TaxID=1071382 RepID=H2AND7_KAZAF|nr:hypothetical protein KAFR_0A04520 [Kazachstania africana CBS 2517]CCF55887.1 hypothetical protein KAFR_0A04520 [Kazachstania africana CBS 2517]
MDNLEKNSVEPSNALKRKNENGTEEEKHIAAAIKRVALDDDTNVQINSIEINRVHSEENEDDENEDDENDGAYGLNTNNEDELQMETENDQNTNSIILRMLCLVKEASLIVGPKGETISKMKKDTNCRINVSKNIKGVPERVIYVKGSCDNVAKAFGLLVRILSQKKTFYNGSSQNQERESQTDLDENNGINANEIKLTEKKSPILYYPATLHLLIPHHLMGYVIGKHGSRLKEIEELSSAKLIASPHQLLPSNDRILRITGVPDAIHIATFYIAQTFMGFKDVLRTNKAIFYQPGPVYTVLGTNNYSQVAVLPLRQNNYHYMNRYNNNYRHRRSPKASLMAMVPSPTIPQYTSNELQVTYTPESVANATSFVPKFTIPHVRIVENTMASQPMALVEQEIYINSNYVGNIIGKEGKHITSIKETTGCSIFIDSPVEGSKERKITIKGSAMGTQAAIMIISNKIEVDTTN